MIEKSGDADRPVEDDPTGMRALLRSLPDPGPMPDHLVRRIQATLAEQERLGVPDAPVVDLGAYRTRRTQRRGPWLAAAAGLVAVAGGGLIATGGATGMIAAFSGTSQSATSVAAGAADSKAAPDGAGLPGSAEGTSVTGMLPAGSVHVIMTEGQWSGSDLGPAARVALTSTGDRLRELASESPAIGPIGTAIGGRDCASALGIPGDAGVLIDLVTHDGEPAALVVAATASGEQTAYLVGRSCRTGHSELRVGPQSLPN